MSIAVSERSKKILDIDTFNQENGTPLVGDYDLNCPHARQYILRMSNIRLRMNKEFLIESMLGSDISRRRKNLHGLSRGIGAYTSIFSAESNDFLGYITLPAYIHIGNEFLKYHIPDEQSLMRLCIPDEKSLMRLGNKDGRIFMAENYALLVQKYIQFIDSIHEYNSDANLFEKAIKMVDCSRSQLISVDTNVQQFGRPSAALAIMRLIYQNLCNCKYYAEKKIYNLTKSRAYYDLSELFSSLVSAFHKPDVFDKQGEFILDFLSSGKNLFFI
jgi:hypothetical protein